MSKIINLHNSINKYFSDFETKYLENIILDKNYNIIFDHKINFNGYFVNGLIYNENNEITIKINPYSSESILFILMHEITHAIYKNKLKELVINYLIQELDLIEDDCIVSDELICDIAGVLLGNTKFLNYLYNNSNYNININNNYDNFINDFLINWEYCYKNNIININNIINLSITEQKYQDISKDWLKNKTNNGLIKNAISVRLNNKIYRVNNINKIVHENNEVEVAIWLKNMFGGTIEYLPNINEDKGIACADYRYKGEFWDLKELNGNGKRTLEDAIKKKKKQSKNFIIDITKSQMTKEEILRQGIDIYSKHSLVWVDKLILKKDNELIAILARKK